MSEALDSFSTNYPVEGLRVKEFLLHLVVASLIIFGIWGAFGPKMIFGWLGDILEKRVPDALNKPIWSCPPCMASVWGSIYWFSVGGRVEWVLPFVLALSGFNRIVASNLLK